MLHSNLGINEKGHLTLAGADVTELAKKYSTPLFLMDENRIRERAKIYVDSMREFFGEGSMPLFASKSASFKRIYKIVDEEGMGTDIVSAGELYTAHSAGFPMEKAFFHGNNKTDSDIAYAMDCGIGYFVADNREELEVISAEAKKRGKVQKILLRLTPGIDPHTQEKISTGKVDSKFGTAIETGQAAELCRFVLGLENVSLEGFHCHIGSQIFEYKPFSDAAEIMLRLMKKLSDEMHIMPKILNLGGGFGVRYIESDPEIDIRESIKRLSGDIKAICDELCMPLPVILMEPGRSIVADSGMTLYTVGSYKSITGYKNYISVDGGMADNPRFALYGSDYTVLIANKANEAPDTVATIAGRCCESGDIIQEDVKIKTPQRGDILAVLVTGAYNYSMSSNYNRIPRPPVIMLKDGTDSIAVKRETFEDICRGDIL